MGSCSQDDSKATAFIIKYIILYSVFYFEQSDLPDFLIRKYNPLGFYFSPPNLSKFWGCESAEHKISKLASKLSTKLFWKFFRPFWPSSSGNQEKEDHHKMGTVLSFSPKNNHYDENNGTVPSVKE